MTPKKPIQVLEACKGTHLLGFFRVDPVGVLECPSQSLGRNTALALDSFQGNLFDQRLALFSRVNEFGAEKKMVTG